jgi:N-acetylglutamate synthase-like GNAT family acetyltransferase
MSLSIRTAEQNDIAVLCNLMEELSGHAISPEQMANRLQFVEESKFDSLFVCEEDERILGLLGFRIRENLEEASRFGEISVIVVYPHDRHKGVGRFMMQYAEKLARELGCIGTWLVSGSGREEKSHEFYKQLGYQINGYRFIKIFE